MAFPLIGLISLIGSLAPTIAGALSTKGRWYEKALKILSSFVGGSNLSSAEIDLRLRNLDQEKFVELKRMDHEFRIELEENKHEMNVIDAEIRKLNVRLNIEDSRSSDKFVSRWRPFIAWVCGLAFAYYFLVMPITTSLMALSIVFGVSPELLSQVETAMPKFDIYALMTMLGYLLGYGGFRTMEKLKFGKE